MPLVNMALARMFFGTPLSRRIGLGGVCGVAGIAIFEAYDWGWATALGIALAILGNVLALNVKPEVPSPPPSTKPVA